MSTEKVITLTKLLELTREELLEMARKQREDQQDEIRIVYLPAGMPNPPFSSPDFYAKFNDPKSTEDLPITKSLIKKHLK